MGLEYSVLQLVVMAINLAFASIVLSVVGLLVGRAKARVGSPLRYSLMSAVVVLTLCSFLPIWIAAQLGHGLVSIETSSGRSIPSLDLTTIISPQTISDAAVVRPFEGIPDDQSEDSSDDEQSLVSSPMDDLHVEVSTDVVVHRIERLSRWEWIGLSFTLVWLLVVIWRIAAIIRAFVLSVRIRQSLMPSCDSRLRQTAQNEFMAAGIMSRATLYESPRIHAPITIGIWNSVVAMPEGLAHQLSDKQLAALIAHEAAHIARRDTTMAFLQQITTAIFWWNPMLRCVNRQIRQLREHLCDDYVTLRFGDGQSLAESIVRTAEWSAIKTLPSSLVLGLLDHRTELAQRICRLTSGNRPAGIHLGFGSRTLLLAFSLLLGLALMLPVGCVQVAAGNRESDYDFVIPAYGMTEVGERDDLFVEQSKAHKSPLVDIAPVAIRVSGIVKDGNSGAIAAAKVYLCAVQGADEPLAEAITDEQGRYEFRDVMFPLKQHGQDRAGFGTIQVVAEAEGFSIGWHGMRMYTDGPRPEYDPPQDQDHSIYAGEPIKMDITLGSPRSLTGRMIDDQGHPVTGVEVCVRDLDYLETVGREMHWNYRQCRSICLLPSRFHEATTDEQGQFTIQGLPDQTVALVYLSHPQYADQCFYAAISTRSIKEYRYIEGSMVTHQGDENDKYLKSTHTPIWKTRSVLSLPIEVQLKSVRQVAVTLIQENGDPAPIGSVVSASTGHREHQTSSYGEVDEAGRALLKLPPGEYRIHARPPRESDLLPTESELVVAAEPAEQAVTRELTTGVIVTLEVVDAQTGRGIPGVSFVQCTQGVFRGTSLITDEDGKCRAVAPPGPRRYQTGFAEGYEIDLQSKTAKCEPGKAEHLKFTLQRERTR